MLIKGTIQSALKKAFLTRVLNQFGWRNCLFNSFEREHLHQIIDFDVKETFH
jgi:hypothetical protein